MAIGFVFPLIFALLALLVKGNTIGNYLLGIMSAISGLASIWFFLGLSSDGSITETVGSTTTAIASATISQAGWNFITYMSLILALIDFMAAIYRVWGD